MTKVLIPPDDLTAVLNKLSREIFAVRNPKTGKPIRLTAESGKHSYLIFSHAGDEYCYTPHPDDGWFYSFVLKGIGRGARSGKPHTWRVTKVRAHRKRKDAKERAIRMRDQARASRIAKDVKP